MEFYLKLIIFVISSSLSFSYVIEGDEPGNSILWPTEYYLKAETMDLKTGVVEPFEVWYSAEKNKTRTDYYEGMVKRYYYGESENNSATIYQINPVTNSYETNEMVCRSYGGDDLVDYLPNADDFTYQGEQTIDDKTVQVWKSEGNDDDMAYKVEKVLYTYRDGDTDAPVRLEEIKYRLWTNGLDDHTITNFYVFKTILKSEDLEVENLDYCDELGKLGDNLRIDLQILHPGFSGDVDKAFNSFKKHYNKKHGKHEHEMRKAIFKENWRRIVDHNKKNLGYKLEVNAFADRSEEELAYLTGTRPSGPQAMGTIPFPHSEKELKAMEEEIPLNYDMRQDGVISPVKNQGECGSCWAFSTTAAVEGALARSNGGRNIDLSEQSLVDCAWDHNMGCDGGILDEAFKYITINGIPSQREYGPYLQQDGYCKLENMTQVYSIKGFAKVPSLSESALKVALLKYGPVTVGIYAGRNMKFYSSGIFYDIDCSKKMLNHGVTVVGYGVRDGTNYWIIKNSWGEDWGEDGYILVSTVNDNCNVMSEAYYPIV
ncbi:unnamed protein product [Parnassius apollo]|uniref:(apollo) hypothetical protein n=1 Tax=Parnassius apollo TaxID=110799 RepID=A0A8S3WUC3_PARAO|nr:unnamed protein product [Parnassius apollo]